MLLRVSKTTKNKLVITILLCETFLLAIKNKPGVMKKGFLPHFGKYRLLLLTLLRKLPTNKLFSPTYGR
jgi:hypothetical protein